MSTLQRQPGMPDVINEIREALMRPVLEASHKRVPTARSRAAVARAAERQGETLPAAAPR